MTRLTIVATGLVMMLASVANAAEIKVVSSVGMKHALDVLAPQFEKVSEHKLKITYGTAVPLSRQIDAGETFDLLILTPPLIDTLAKSGKVAGGTATNIAKIGIGVAVRKGAPKPDIRSVEAFKRALVNAKAIAYSKEGQSGTAVAKLIDRLGLAAQLKDKTVIETRSGMTPANVIDGKADLAFALISEILPFKDAELVGPLPAEIQTYVVFTSGFGPNAKDRAAAQAFVDFLRSPAALPALKAAGMEPG